MTSKREAQLLNRVHALVVDATASLAIDVLDVELRGQTPRRVVRVTADVASLDPDEALDVDMIADASREIGAALDEADVIPGSYTLEVTSPGADRPLRTDRDFARNVGRKVRLTFTDDAGTQDVVGELVSADASAVTLRIDGQETPFARADVDYGKVVLPW